MTIDIQRYIPPGPIGAAFIRSRGPIDTIMGPGGSGKTVCSVIKGPLLAAEYMPVCRDGWVRVKTLCVRDTYRSFARTALASWYNTFPEKHAWTVSHEGGQDRPVVHKLCWEAWRGADKVKVEYVMETGAIGDNDLEAFAKGYEISLAWGNEYDLMPPNTLPIFLQRCGRYPPLEMIAPAELERVSRDGRETMRLMGLTVDDSEPVLPRVVWGDMNPPDVDHPAYTQPFGETSKPGGIFRNVTPGWNGFWQPSGLASTAENRAGKPRSSYETEAATTKDPRLVMRMVHSLPAYAADGKPVYPEFSQSLHVADQPLDAVPGLGLTIGIDAGGSPAATIGQPQPNGQDRLLRELVTEPGTGPTRFATLLVEMLLQEFPGIPILGIWADPAAFMGGDSVTGEFNWILTVQAALQKPINPAPSNEPGIRQEAVRWGLSGMIDGNVARYLIDPRCRKMIGGFAAHYKLTKLASVSGTDRLAVVKNEYSHPHDAEQYRVLGYRGLANVIGASAGSVLPSVLQARRRQVEARPRPGDFNIWDV